MARIQKGPERPPGVKYPPNPKEGEASPPEGYKIVKIQPEVGGGKFANIWHEGNVQQEMEFREEQFISWRKVFSLKHWWKVVHWKNWIKLSWWYWYLAIIAIGVLVGLYMKYDDQIMAKLRPIADKTEAIPGGFVIPAVVLCVMSFPPMFGVGQEVIILLVGAVWGLWIGMGITAAGTASGDIATFYAFQWFLKDYAKKMREDPKNPTAGMLAYMVQEEKHLLLLLIVVRYSAIPGPVSTAIFASCNVNMWKYLLAIFFTLPKQLIVVYLGVIFADGKDAGKDEKIITYSSMALAIVLTLWSAWYIYAKMKRIRILMWRREQLGMDPLFPQRPSEKEKDVLDSP